MCIQVQKMENTETLGFQGCQNVWGLCLGQVCLLNYTSTYRPFLNLPLPAGIISGFLRFWLYFLASFQWVITVCTRTTKKSKVLRWIDHFLQASGQKCRLLHPNQSSVLTLWFIEAFLEFSYSNIRLDIKTSSDDSHTKNASLTVTGA